MDREAEGAQLKTQGEVAGEAPEARMPQRPDDNYEGERADDEDAT